MFPNVPNVPKCPGYRYLFDDKTRDEIQRTQQRHRAFLQDNQQHIDRVEQKLDACVAKLRQVRRYVTEKKQALSHEHDAFQAKNQHMVQQLVHHASRKSPVKAARVAKVSGYRLLARIVQCWPG